MHLHDEDCRYSRASMCPDCEERFEARIQRLRMEYAILTRLDGLLSIEHDLDVECRCDTCNEVRAIKMRYV